MAECKKKIIPIISIWNVVVYSPFDLSNITWYAVSNSIWTLVLHLYGWNYKVMRFKFSNFFMIGFGKN